MQAIKTGPRGAIGVMMYQWTGPRLQAPVVPWTFVDDQASVRDFADLVDRSQRQLFGGGTSISGAIDYGVQALAETPFAGGRQVIDVSGDGANNGGRPATSARDDAVARGRQHQRLADPGVGVRSRGALPQQRVGGPGAFVVPAATFEDFATAVLRKLIMEIAAGPVPFAGQG